MYLRFIAGFALTCLCGCIHEEAPSGFQYRVMVDSPDNDDLDDWDGASSHVGGIVHYAEAFAVEYGLEARRWMWEDRNSEIIGYDISVAALYSKEVRPHFLVRAGGGLNIRHSEYIIGTDEQIDFISQTGAALGADMGSASGLVIQVEALYKHDSGATIGVFLRHITAEAEFQAWATDGTSTVDVIEDVDIGSTNFGVSAGMAF